MNLVTTQDFIDAIAKHLDNAKPDLMVCNQVKALKLSYTAGAADSSISHQGTMKISNDYLAIIIHSSFSELCNHMNLEERHQFSFQLRIVDVEFLDASKKQGLDRKIHAEKVQRLKDNSHVQRLLGDLDVSSSSKQVLICESHIEIHTSQPSTDSPTRTTVVHQEDRYEVLSPILSALHVMLFSQMDGLVDILALLLNLPFLPRKKFSMIRGYQDLCPVLYQLGDKAVLRLMEDLLVDECARAEEEENDEDSEDEGEDESVEKVDSLSIRDEQAHDVKRLKT